MLAKNPFFLCQTHVQAMRAVQWVSSQTVAVTQRLTDGVTYGVSLQRERQESQRKRAMNHCTPLKNTFIVLIHFLEEQISILEWSLKYHVTLKIQFCITGINYILKYYYNRKHLSQIVMIFHSITVFTLFCLGEKKRFKKKVNILYVVIVSIFCIYCLLYIVSRLVCAPVWLSGRALRQQRKRLWVWFPGNTYTDKKICITWMQL